MNTLLAAAAAAAAADYFVAATLAEDDSDMEELKFFDTALSWNFDTTAEVPATGQLSLIPQGDTESTRDGRKAVVKSVQIRGSVYVNPTTGGNVAGTAQIWLVLDTQANGAAAAFTDVFTSTDVNSCMLNLNNSGRFKVLKHWILCWNPEAGVTTAWNSKMIPVEYYQSLDVPIDWSGATGAITEIRSNNLFLLAGQTGIGDDVPTFTGTCRLRFVG